MVQINNTQGIEAYNKALKASTGVRPAESMQAAQQTMNVLRSGDNLEVVSIGNKANTTLFPEVLNQVVKTQTNKIRIADERVRNNFTPDDKGMATGSDLIEVMAAVNESEMALQVVIAARDKFISSYQEIIKMPL